MKGLTPMTDYGSTPPPPPPSFGPPAFGPPVLPPVQDNVPASPSAFNAYPPAYGSMPPPMYAQQGAPSMYAQQGPPPNNHLVWAIVSTLLFFFPLGVASIVYAAQVNSKWVSGDLAGARNSAAKAKTFAMWSTIVAVGIVVFMFGLALLGAILGTTANSR